MPSPTPPRARPMSIERATLIYDGECGLCREAVALVTRWDGERRVTLIPFQDQTRVAAFRIPLPALAAAMHLVLPDGRVLAGADAAPELLRLLPGKRHVLQHGDEVIIGKTFLKFQVLK